MDVVSSVISILSPVVNPIIRQARYAFKVSENVNALCSATKELLAKKADVAEQIQLDAPKERKVTKEVEEWMDQVDAVEKEVHEIEERYNQRSCQFFKGFSLNCFSNYAIGKAAFKKLSGVQGLCDKNKFERVTVEKLPPPVQMLSTTTIISPTQKPNLERALNYINNDNNAGIIGIWGMGGVGKTHLLNQINNSFKGNSIFDHVIFVTASKECSVEKIQNGIAKRLDLELKDHVDIQPRANRIFNFLSKRNFLLLLDDLWERVDLGDVGIPFPLGNKRKVVLTTRFSTVCRQMETKKEIRVGCLNKEDAWSLFEDKVDVETIQSNPNIRAHAEDLVCELDGLPLALITIGRAMRAKNDSSDWEHAIQLLRASRLPEIEECPEEESLFRRLKFSYDSLKTDILRRCFLACSLCPEDYEIEKTDIIQLWLGLGIVEELGNPDIYSPGYALIRNLLDTCLLEEGQSGDHIKMHDVIRDMALWIARDCGKNMNKWIINEGGGLRDSSILLPNDIWCKAEYIALRGYDKILDIQSIVSETNLKTLIINGCSMFETIRNGIHNFSCLTFLDLSKNNLSNFPKTICQIVNLRYLNLSYNLIDALPIDLKYLINLRYLFLSKNFIREVPSGVFSQLKELIILDLLQYLHVFFNSSNVLKDIVSLKKIKSFSISVSNNSELQRLSDLVHVPVRGLWINYLKLDEADNSILITPSFLGESDRQKGLFELSFHECPGKRQLVFENSQRSINWRFQNLIHLVLFGMSDLKNVVYKGVVPENLFPQLRNLNIVDCISIKNFSWIIYLQCLRRLQISGADSSVHELFTIEQASSSQRAEIEEVRNETPINKTFPSLEIMRLGNLPNVKSICPPHIAFPSLKELWVYGCSIARLPFNRTTVPNKLECIRGSRKWWGSLEWEDELHKSSLEKFFKEW